MIGVFLVIVLGRMRHELLKQIKPGSEEDYSDEFPSLGHHPAKYKPSLIFPYPLRVRIQIWLIAIAVVLGMGWFNLFDCFFYLFIVTATLIWFPFVLFVKFPQYDPNAPIEPDWQPQTKKEYYVPNIRARAFWAPFLSWLAFSSAVLGLMIYEVIVCSGCFLELLSLIVLGIMWKRNCGASKRPAAGPPRNLDT